MAEGDEEDILSIQRVLSGDSAAFAVLVRKYERRLRSFCRSRLPEAEVDDAAQEVFVKAFKSLGGFRLGASFCPWLFSIAMSTIARKKHRYRNEVDKTRRLMAEADGHTGQNEGLANLEGEFLRKAVRELPPAYRDVVELYYFAELSTEESAKALGLGVEAVKSRLFRARKLLQEMMEGRNRSGPQGVY